MKLSRRQLFKGATGLALASAAGTAITHRASAHVDVDQEIVITMGEMFFQADGQEAGEAIRVPANQVVRLVFINEGTVLHDAHFGRGPDLEGRLYEENLAAPFDMLEIPAGGEAWITFTFTDDQIGEWEMGCFQLGHYEGGMVAPFIIE